MFCSWCKEDVSLLSFVSHRLSCREEFRAKEYARQQKLAIKRLRDAAELYSDSRGEESSQEHLVRSGHP